MWVMLAAGRLRSPFPAPQLPVPPLFIHSGQANTSMCQPVPGRGTQPSVGTGLGPLSWLLTGGLGAGWVT